MKVTIMALFILVCGAGMATAADTALEQLKRDLKHTDPVVRKNAVEKMAEADPQEAVPALMVRSQLGTNGIRRPHGGC